jgi:hypothetical protein
MASMKIGGLLILNVIIYPVTGYEARQVSTLFLSYSGLQVWMILVPAIILKALLLSIFWLP